MKDERWDMFMVIGKLYCINILEALFQSPKRFSDLNKACPIEKTRAKRLKELTSNNLIETIIKSIGKRNFIHYTLTEKGDNIFKRILDFNK